MIQIKLDFYVSLNASERRYHNIFRTDFQMLFIVTTDVHISFNVPEPDLFTLDRPLLSHICFIIFS